MGAHRQKRSSWPRRLSTIVLCALVLRLPCTRRASASEGDLEAKVKAAYLLNFTRYVNWPPEAFASLEDPFVICLLGAATLEPVLSRTLAGRQSQGRPLVARRLEPRNGEVAAEGCHVLFVGRQADPSPILGALRGRPTLTVGEQTGFLAAGGIVAFVIVDETVRFAANRSAAARSGLKLSSELLRVAHAIVQPSEGAP